MSKQLLSGTLQKSIKERNISWLYFPFGSKIRIYTERHVVSANSWKPLVRKRVHCDCSICTSVVIGCPVDNLKVHLYTSVWGDQYKFDFNREHKINNGHQRKTNYDNFSEIQCHYVLPLWTILSVCLYVFAPNWSAAFCLCLLEMQQLSFSETIVD